jgi:DNA (cytosine-5)-methyltransferase 1
MSLGLSLAGFRPVYAIDNDRESLLTYRHNIGAHVDHVDLAAVPADEAAELVSSAINQSPDVICGGPPCQGFSIQRRGKDNDPRNGLFAKFTEIATRLNPRAILMENVPTVLGKRGGLQVREAFSNLARAGYNVQHTILQAADFGVPQFRRRAFILALNGSVDPASFAWPAAITPSPNHVTVRSAIADLPEPPEDHSEHEEYANHTRVQMSSLNLQRIRHVPEGGGRVDIPPELQLECHRKDNGHRHLDVYGRLVWDSPSGTLTAMFDNFTRGRFAHPARDRNLTSREGARLQSFPDDFVFVGSKKSIARQIGNAVPPLLARSVGLALRNAFRGANIRAESADKFREHGRVPSGHIAHRDANSEELRTGVHVPEERRPRISA